MKDKNAQMVLDNLGDFSDENSQKILKDTCKNLLKVEIKSMNNRKRYLNRKIANCKKNLQEFEDEWKTIAPKKEFKDISTMLAEKADVKSKIIESFMELAFSKGDYFTSIFLAVPKERTGAYRDARTKAMTYFVLDTLDVGKIW